MEGLIPFLYKAIVHYRNGYNQADSQPSWRCDESPSASASYVRLAGDEQDSASSSSFSNGSVRISASGIQSPLRRLVPRRVAA
ncbi:hypothetical protein SDJN03_04246, partial [Cucurbita argyrosperma subsp. sororia]